MDAECQALADAAAADDATAARLDAEAVQAQANAAYAQNELTTLLDLAAADYEDETLALSTAATAAAAENAAGNALDTALQTYQQLETDALNAERTAASAAAATAADQKQLGFATGLLVTSQAALAAEQAALTAAIAAKNVAAILVASLAVAAQEHAVSYDQNLIATDTKILTSDQQWQQSTNAAARAADDAAEDAAAALPAAHSQYDDAVQAANAAQAAADQATQTAQDAAAAVASQSAVTDEATAVADAFQANAASADATAKAADAAAAAWCFLRGTLIAQPSGETLVEHLTVGSHILTAAGRSRPIVWIGKGHPVATRGRRNAATPIIIRKGALAANVPHRDLRVTKGHSFYFDGVLIPAEFLVNHRSILWDDHAQGVEIYHIELETHDVLLANGAPAESYRDDGNRWLFQNANAGWNQPPKPVCAPVLTGGPIVDAVWRRLLDRSGWRPGVPVTTDPDLHLLVAGRRLDATTRSRDTYAFFLPETPDVIHIASRAAAPQELGFARDPRILGICLGGVEIRGGARQSTIQVSDPMLNDGFHEFESELNIRWTNGLALLPHQLLAGFDGPVDVIIHKAQSARYVLESDSNRLRNPTFPISWKMAS